MPSLPCLSFEADKWGSNEPGTTSLSVTVRHWRVRPVGCSKVVHPTKLVARAISAACAIHFDFLSLSGKSCMCDVRARV